MTIGHGIYGLKEPEIPKKPPSRWRYVWRVGLFFIVMILGMNFILSRMDGPSQSNKQLVEDILSDLTAQKVKIETLHHLTYSPVLGIDIEDMRLGERSRIGRFQYATGFLSWVTGQIEFRVLAIENALFEGGLIKLPLDLQVKSLIIDIKEITAPVLRGQGSYGGKDFSFDMPMRFKPTLLGHPRFVFAKESELNMRLGEVVLRVRIVDPFGLRSTYHILSISRPGRPDWGGMISLSPDWNGTRITGTLTSRGQKMEIDLLRPQDPKSKITGTLAVNILNDPVWDDLVDLIQTLRVLYKGNRDLETIQIQDVDVTVIQTDGKKKQWTIRDRMLVSNPFKPAQ